MKLTVSNKLRRVFKFSVFLGVDLISILLIFKLSIVLRTDYLPRIYAGFPAELPNGNIIVNWWIFTLWVVFLCYEGLYSKVFSFWDEIKALWKVVFYSLISIFLIVTLGKLNTEVSRTVVLLMGVLAMGIMPATRGVSKKVLRKLGLLNRRALILGAGEQGRLILQALKREPNYGYDVRGFIDDNLELRGRTIDGLKVHNGLDKAERYIGICGIQDVFIAIPEERWEKLKGLVNRLQHKAERVLFVPGISGIAVTGMSIQHFFHEQIFALELRNNLAEPLNLILKRSFEILLSLICLPFFLLLFCIISLAVKLESRGPVLFAHKRVGQHGKPFRCLKFRTMYRNSEERLVDLLDSDPIARKEWRRYRKLKDDPRVTRVGRFLRETSFDEFPQIINVLKGEMSLVGPRPVTQEEISLYYKSEAPLCFSVPPGISGLWQVSGRNNTGYDNRVALDLWYVRNWNLWVDIVIIFKTIGVVFKKTGAV